MCKDQKAQQSIGKLCRLNAKQADSNLLVAQAYRDTAMMKNKQAETFYLKVAEDYKYVIQNDTTFKVKLIAWRYLFVLNMEKFLKYFLRKTRRL